jgi:hypothetical protein
MNRGYIVNYKSLFGDADFWTFLRDKHPSLFTRLADFVKGLPTPVMQFSLYAQSWVNPVALIKHHYPTAFAVIHGARPDFDSDLEPILLTKPK